MAIRRFTKLLAELKRKAKARAKDALERKPRRLELQRLEDRHLMAGIPVQIDPQPGRVLDNATNAVNTLKVAPTEVLLDFQAFGSIAVTGTTPQAQTLELSRSIKLVRAGFDNSFTNGTVAVEPGFLGIGDQPYQVIMRFKDPLPDDKYQFQITGIGSNALLNSKGQAFHDGSAALTPTNAVVNMDLELGAKVVAVVPQPIDRTGTSGNWLTQNDRVVMVYFERGDELLDQASVQNKDYYQFYATRNSLDPNDQTLVPSSAINNIVYDTTLNAARITFNSSLASLGLVADDGTPDAVKAFRLRVGTNETKRDVVTVNTTAVDPDTAAPGSGANGPGWSFATAMQVGDLSGGATGQSRVYAQAIDTQFYGLTYPGGQNDPGHRDVPAEQHVTGDSVREDARDVTDGIRTQYYNFRKEISDISGGATGTQRATNNITDKQKDLARQIFDMYSRISGIQFIERVNPKPLEQLTPVIDPELDDVVVATGDFRVFNDTSLPGGTIGLAGTEPIYGLRLALMDGAETWNELLGDAPYDGSAPGQLSWYTTAMHEIGHLLGLGHSYDLPERTVQGDDAGLTGTATPETILPGDADIVHMQYMYRPESKDIDMYQFSVSAFGTLSLETMAERLHDSSTLDTYLTVWRQLANGTREVVGRNDDYYSKDSALEIKIDDAAEFGVYYVGVTAKGNDSYDPTIADSGLGGTTSGKYELRLDFQRDVDANNSIKDVSGSLIDGDGDGVAGGASNFWFRTAKPMEANGTRVDSLARTIFVDKSAPRAGSSTGYVPNGSPQRPFHDIDDALAAARAFDIVRIVGNPGADGSAATVNDTLPYKIGFDPISGLPLEDGSVLAVPKDVTVMIDAGAVFQFYQGWISVGSTSPSISSDRSGGALQILGTPQQKAYFTSYNEQGTGLNKVGVDQNAATTTPQSGDWGGISFHSDVDKADGRFNFEDRGVFMNYINYADIRYGGGDVLVEGVTEAISPVRMVDSRPTITNNVITSTRNAAMTANPDSFEESNFRAPRYYKSTTTRLNTDYKRVGPEIRGNSMVRFDQLTAGANPTFSTTAISNSINGLFIRSTTPAGNTLEEMTIAGRFDDLDIVHILSENLIVSGTAGGARLETQAPTTNLITATRQNPTSSLIGRFNGTTAYEYRFTFVDAFGNEGPASGIISTTATGFPLQPNASGQFIRLSLPEENAPLEGAVARRVYRKATTETEWKLIGSAPPKTAFSFNDLNQPNVGLQQVLQDATLTSLARARLDGSLVVDPRIIVKAEGARIEIESGANLIAEGVDGREVVFTSQSDDRWGAGGTFDTRNDNGQPSPRQPAAGDWAGIQARPDSSLSIDQAVIAYGGGLSRIEGALTGINAVEVLQADARIANSRFEFNDNGIGGEAPLQREGRGVNSPAVIFVRGAQPIIVNNVLTNNLGTNNAAISINVNALNSEYNIDLGRQRPLNREVVNPTNNLTIDNDRVPEHLDNQGPLVVGNRMFNNSLNGMVVRGGILTTESVWDDTDITHILLDATTVDTNAYITSGQVIAPDMHTYGGLRLESKVNESLVVKASGANAGLIANGRPLEMDDRIGGTIQILGQPGFPVILTSLTDDSASAGVRPDGTAQSDADNNNQPLVLTPGPEDATTGTTIDNDLASTSAGYMSMQIIDGGEVGANNLVSVPFGGLVLQNQQFVNQFLNYVRVGTTTTNLKNSSNIVSAARVGTEDVVTSSGTFQGDAGQIIDWAVESRIAAGKTSVVNTIKFNARSGTLGALQFINLMDANIGPGTNNDVLYRLGSGPGQANFRVATLDDARRYGIAQGGVYQQDGSRLINATWNGFAGNTPANLIASVNSLAGQAFAPNGSVTGLPQRVDTSLGNIWGNADIASAMGWTVNGTSTTATITTFLDLVPVNPVNSGSPGEWSGILLDQYSNDRNVDTIIEAEQPIASAVDANPNPEKSQLLGYLAANEKSGDDNLRLGFTVQGTLRSASDVDVYTFFADAGTEIWLDIDRTWTALDTVVELIDDQGNKQFLSNNSWKEGQGAENPFEGSDYTNQIRKMQKVAPYDGKDFYLTNPRDAAFRVTLPGPAGQHKYHIRVRSANPNVLQAAGTGAGQDNIASGLTKGSYQLQLRLRETDEFGGSSIRYADIRNAVTGIDVRGLPLHSPLTGEAGEPANENGTNDIRANSTNVGNLLTRDRGTISIAGSLGGVDASALQNRVDVDWYQFDIQYDATQQAANGTYPVEIDADFADNIGRPNINLYLYDSTGRLIIASVDSNVSDDRPSPNSQQDFADLSRGSGGGRDALIGPIGLPTGRYFLAVTNQGATPNALGNNTTLRLEPLNSLEKIVEDHIEDYLDPFGNPLPTTSIEVAEVTDLLDTDGSSAIPFHLGDVSLFIAQEDLVAREGTRLYQVDPFTGRVETHFRNADGSLKIGFDVGDIAFGPSASPGNQQQPLYAYELDKDAAANDPLDDAEAGRYYVIDTGLGSATQIGADGIVTYELDATGAPQIAHNVNNTRIGWGMNFQAIAYGGVNRSNGGTRLLGIANSGNAYQIGTNFDQYKYIPSRTNILYTLDPNTGAYSGSTTAIADRTPPLDTNPTNLPAGAYTPQLEVGEIPTQPILNTVEATAVRTGGGENNFLVKDGQLLQVDDGSGIVTYEMDAGLEIRNEASRVPGQYYNPLPTAVSTNYASGYYTGNTIIDGDFFVLDPTLDVGTQASTLNDETIFQFDSGRSVVFNQPISPGNAAFYDGKLITVTGVLGRTTTFELDADGVAQSGGTTLVTIGAPVPGSQPPVPSGNGNVAYLAQQLAAAISADTNLGVFAIAIGGRVSFINTVSPGVDVIVTPDTLLITGAAPAMTFTGSTGFAPVLKVLPASYDANNVPQGNTITAGQQFSVSVNLGTPQTFDYRFVVDGNNGGVTTGYAININSTDNPTQVASTIYAALTNVANPGYNRLTAKYNTSAPDKVLINGFQVSFNQLTSSLINMTAATPGYPNMRRVTVAHDESYPLWVPRTPANPTPVSVAQNIEDAVNNNSVFVAGADLNRLNFPDFSSAAYAAFYPQPIFPGPKQAPASLQFSVGDPAQGSTYWFSVTNSTNGVSGGNILIPYLAEDGNTLQNDPAAYNLGDRIAAAINYYQPNMTAAAQADRVTLLRGGITVPGVDPNLPARDQMYSVGEGPGGTVTGMANLNGEIYVVTDAGGLYHILTAADNQLTEFDRVLTPDRFRSLIPANSHFVSTEYIGTSDLVGINFQGLTPGPQSTENGKYANMLFAVADDGSLYAIGTAGAQTGRLQPIFLNGAVSMATGLASARGLAFSNLEENLWQTTPTVNVPGTINELQSGVDQGRASQHGVASDGFSPGATNPSRDSLGGQSSYRFGNDNGTVISTYDYAGGAHGTVISNEFSLKGYSSGDQPVMYFNYFVAAGADDALRVSIADNGGNWVNVATGFTRNSNNWHQARVDLSGFAGLENLRLRFDFITGGDLDVGQAFTHGDELYAVDARYIADGSQVTFSDGTALEFDSGYSLQVSSGRAVQADSTLIVAGTGSTAPITLQFTKPGVTPAVIPGAIQVSISDADTPRQVADKIATAVQANAAGTRAWFGNSLNTTVLDDNIVNFAGAVGLKLGTGTGSFSGVGPQTGMTILGSNGYRLHVDQGSAITDGETFVIYDGVNAPLTVEFDSDGTINTPASPNRLVITYTVNDSSATIAAALETAINGAGRNLTASRPSLALVTAAQQDTVMIRNALLITNPVPGAIELEVNGAAFGNVRVPIHRGMDRWQTIAGQPGVGAQIRTAMNASYQDPEILAKAGNELRDGMSFALTDGWATPVEFEFDSGFILNLPAAGAVPNVAVNPNSTTNPYVAVGDEITLSDGGANTLTIRFVDSTYVDNPLDTIFPIVITPQSTQAFIAQAIESLFQTAGPITPIKTALGLDGVVISGGRVQLGGAVGVTMTTTAGADLKYGNIGTPAQLQINIPANGGNDGQPIARQAARFDASTYVGDGDKLTITDGVNSIVLEFHRNDTITAAPTTAGAIVINVTDAMTQAQVATAVLNAINSAPLATRTALGITAAIAGGSVTLGGNADVILVAGEGADSVKYGIFSEPGVAANRIPIYFREYSGFTTTNAAAAIEAAIDGSTAASFVNTTINAALPYRISMVRSLRNNQTLAFTANTSPIVLQSKTDIIKGYRDLVNVIGRDVVNAGPLGLDAALAGDPAEPAAVANQGISNNPTAADFLRRGQDNRYEGAYMDDFIIGFAERGVMATYTTAVSNDTFAVGPPVINNEGPYQVEIRRSAIYGTPTPLLVGTAEELARSFNTNDRVTRQIQVVARPGANISDGQTFTLTDGGNYITFEFNDTSITPASGVTQGNLRIDYLPSDTEEVIARKIRDAINGPDAKAALKFSAATSDGLAPFDTTSTDNTVNVHGTASTQVPAHAAPEINDTAAVATPIDLASSDKPVYFINGTIGDRADLNNAFLAEQDVDLFSLEMFAGQRVYLDIDADSLGSTLDSYLRIFQPNGLGGYTEVANSDDDLSPGETQGTLDSYLEFVAPTAGVYLIGVSAFNNSVYNPVNGLNAVPGGTTGFYQLEVNSSLPSSIDVTVFDEPYGDSNQFRDQGQLIIRDNIISNSLTWGISIDAAARTAVDGNQAHPGSVRYTPQINNNRLVPGVVVTNNVIARNQTGGILFSGDPNTGNVGEAPVAFGRILNNTLYGVGGTLADSGLNDIGISVTDNSSPTLMNNILANFDRAINVSANSQTLGTIVKSTVYQGNVVNSNVANGGDLATLLQNTDPLFANANTRDNFFYLAKFSQAIDSASKSLLDRSEMERVRSPLGISTSPIIAPDFDIYGSKRVDDGSSSTPNGLGDNKFTDRGAVERSDFSGPTANLVNPLDNGPFDRDQRPAPPVTVALPDSYSLDRFEIQFQDIDATSGTNTGTGIDDATVTTDTVILRDVTDPTNPRLLVEGVDYFFLYNATTNTITLLPVGVEFQRQRTYEIELDINNGNETDLTPAIRDRAGNLLKPNQVVGGVNMHKYTISLGTAIDFGDAPSSYLVTRAQNGPRHENDGVLYLGNSPPGISLESDGVPSATASSDTYDDGITIAPGALVVNGESTFVARASAPGKLDVWIDLNNDGTFATFVSGGINVSEHINTFDITAGNTDFIFNIPKAVMSKAIGGTTYARFRLTANGIDSPIGLATSGEVEDYQINIVQPPFRNPNPAQIWQGQFGLDVDANGLIEALDLAWVLHLFSQRQSSGIQLPSPSPPNLLPDLSVPNGLYYDVNGDNLVDAGDVLALVAYFQSPDYRSTYGEGEGSDVVAAPTVVEPAAVAGVPATLYASSGIDVEVKTVSVEQTAAEDVIFTAFDNASDNSATPVVDSSATAFLFGTPKQDATTVDLLAVGTQEDDLLGPTQSADDEWEDLVDLLAGDDSLYGPL